MKVIVQEIINKFLDPEHLLQEGKREDLFQNNIEHGNITEFKDIKTQISSGGIVLLLRRDCFSELTWLVKKPITYCNVSFETPKSVQTVESRN